MAKQRRRPDSGLDGVVVIDKGAGWTSHDVVAKCRGILGTRKIGHSGTLDPDATGILVLGVGKATRLLRFLTELPKTYTGEIVLGIETSTLDAAGDVTAAHDMRGTTLEQARAAAVGLTGAIEQIPPMVSAIQIDGRRLHELAREGIEVEREPRPVTVHRFDLHGPIDGSSTGDGDNPVFRCEVACSSGTYIRSLAADLGHVLGGGAHLRNLRRTEVGGFTLADAVTLDALGPDAVRPIGDAVRHLPCVSVDDDLATDVGHGKVLPAEALGIDSDGTGHWAILDAEGTLLAVYEPYRSATVKPTVVIPK